MHKERKGEPTAAPVDKACDFELTQIRCDLTVWEGALVVVLAAPARRVVHVLHADWTVLESTLTSLNGYVCRGR